LPDAPDREKELAVREKETPDGDKEAPGRVKEASDCVPAFHLQGNAEQTAFHKIRASSSSRADLASVGPGMLARATRRRVWKTSAVNHRRRPLGKL